MDSINITVQPQVTADNCLRKLAMQKDSPILSLLRAIRAQTSLGVDDASSVGSVQRDFAFLQEFSAAANPVRDVLTRFVKPSHSDENAPRERLYLEQLKNVQGEVEKLTAPGELKNLCGSGKPATVATEWVNDLGAQLSSRAGTNSSTRLLALPIAAFCGKIKGIADTE